VKYACGVIAGTLVILLAACGSNAPSSITPLATHALNSTSGGTAHDSTPAAAQTPDLNAELLAINDLPAGWSVVSHSGSGGSPAPRCLQHAKNVLKPVGKAEATFADGSDDIPLLDEFLAYLPGGGQSAMAAISRVLSGCRHISVTSDGTTMTGTIGAMSFPAVADQSAAYQMNLSATASGVSVTFGIDLVVFRESDTVAMILYGDLGTPDIQTLQPIVRDAAMKLS